MATKPKNIVICLDGTGNQIEENLSNVLKLYSTVDKNDDQGVFYDQGVGTLGHIYTWGWLLQELKNFLGLGFGLGLDKNVLQAYEFIVQNYSEHKVNGKSKPVGDNIYIFGFSRGAHTARVLAGLIYEVGVIKPDQIHLSGAALTAYKQAQEPRSDGFQKTKTSLKVKAPISDVSQILERLLSNFQVFGTQSVLYLCPMSKLPFLLLFEKNFPTRN